MRLAPFQKEWLEEVLAPDVMVAVQSIPRGNGKSTFRAAVATWALFDPDDTGNPQVPIVATTVKQAMKSIYTPATQMIKAEPELFERSIPFTAVGDTRIWVPFCDGEMFPIANEVGGLQGLDPSIGVVDELAFMSTEAWLALTESSGKRDRSLIAGISTPGLDRDNALWHVRSQMLERGLPPGFRYSEYAATEGCDLDDETQWRHANPAIRAGFLRIEALRMSRHASPEGFFRIFRLGQWVEGVECWLGQDGGKLWDALAEPYDLVPGATTWAGVDVALKKDSTAVTLGQYRGDGRLHASTRLWIPGPGNPVDVTDVMEHLRRAAQTYRLAGVSFDPRFFDVPAKMLTDEGLVMVEVPQSVERMTPAVGSLFELIKRGELSHDGDPRVATQVLGAVARFNERGFTLAKAKSRGRIDAAVSMALMVDLALRLVEEDDTPQVFFG
jgi:phage terminase large subunit-like protein